VYVAHMGGMRNALKILVGKPEEGRLFGIPGCIWEDNIVIDLRETEWEVVDWINLALARDKWRAVVNTEMELQIPYKTENFLTS